jgi:hypothetical protein
VAPLLLCNHGELAAQCIKLCHISSNGGVLALLLERSQRCAHCVCSGCRGKALKQALVHMI